MKKVLFSALLLLVATAVWLILKPQRQSLPSYPQQSTNLPLAAIGSSNIASSARQTGQAANLPEDAPNALTTTNFSQWQTMIPGLKHSDNFIVRDSWVMEQTNRTSGIPVMLSLNGHSVTYKVHFIDVDVLTNGQIQGVRMHSPIMDINETRKLGLELCQMLGRDPGDFLAWCDKVGNHWLDAPLFSSKGTRVPETGKFAGFGILMTYTDAKPWCIAFSISGP